MDYSASSRFLHRVILGSPFLMRSLFRMDTDKHGEHWEEHLRGKHVFISGLARSGTTALMRLLYTSGKYVSLTYRDMPFVVAPNLWRSLRRSETVVSEMRERAHGDGITVNEESPEALDEVFWKLFCAREYIGKDCLRPHEPDEHTIKSFRRYVASILSHNRGEGNLYLSKNNNNILRIQAIHEAFPESVIITPYRHPVEHAKSLFQQHQRFAGNNTEKFTSAYMRWLGHHEFGMHHRPFCFGGKGQPEGNPDDINYWLRLWLNYYTYAKEKYNGRLYFLRYENLCQDPQSQIRRLNTVLGWKIDETGITPYSPPVRNAVGVDAQLLSECEGLYKDLGE